MSGAPLPLDAGDDPALDDGVLASQAVLEFQGWSAVARHGGLAVLPWRRHFLEAQAAGRSCASEAPEAAFFPQCLVRVQKGRAATEADLAAACRALAPGGTLAVTGSNQLGVDAWIRRVERACGAAPRVHVRAKARVARFDLDPARPYPQPAAGSVPLSPTDGRLLTVAPGAFSGDGLDEGTALLVARLATIDPAARVLDLGCGAGHLGIAAALAWPASSLLLADADARATASARVNVQAFGLEARARVVWWDAAEPVPEAGFDLVLINPPAHAGSGVSTGVATTMFRRAAEVLTPGGRVLVVANRRLPYEETLRTIGRCRILDETAGFKIIDVVS